MPNAVVLLSALSLTFQQPDAQNPVDWKVIGRSARGNMIFTSPSARSQSVRVSR